MKKEGTPSYCCECGGEYYAPPSHRAKRTYCSRKCRAAAQSTWQKRPLEERFWEKVDKSGACWVWTGALLKTGYGSIRVNGKSERAHRVAYRLAVGEIPRGLLLRHSCDNPKCVNPSHLVPGTKAQNTRDAIERGQHLVGERDTKSKLTNDDVVAIRALLSSGVKGRYVAKLFNVSESHVSGIKKGAHRTHG